MSKEAIEIHQISEENLIAALGPLRGHLKATSVLWMHVLGAPVLEGLIIKGWSPSSARTLRDFCAKRDLREVLLRIDKYGQRWTDRRGGYLLPVEQVGEVVRELKRDGILAMTLEPVSPYSDRYGLVAVTEPGHGSITVEIVGPGFDVSDILRADLQAHERFVFTGVGQQNSRSAELAWRCTHLISAGDYHESVNQRLIKIGARLKDSAFPRSIKQSSRQARSALRDSAIEYLSRTEQTLLLKHLDRYIPISEKRLSTVVRCVVGMLGGLGNYGIHLGPTSFSASFTKTGRLVFWDFFPARVAEAEALYGGG